MRAITMHRYGGPEVLAVSDVDDPVPGPDQIVIRVEASSVNRSDWESITGKPGYVRMSNGVTRPRRKLIGSDVAGEIVAIGSSVTLWTIGERVYGDLMWHGDGCFAELVATRQDAPLARITPGLEVTDAAAIPQAGGLAHQALHEPHPVGPGDRVLVIGGGGGGGSYAIQLARLAGAEVHGVDNADKQAFMTSLGASRTFDFRTEDFSRSGERYDRIIDFPGRRRLRAIRRVLDDRGVYWIVGGSIPKLLGVLTSGSLTNWRTDRSIRILMGRPTTEAIDEIGHLIADGTISSSVERIYTLEETPNALARLGAGQAAGKLVITPQAP